jgi:hypothetical protein
MSISLWMAAVRVVAAVVAMLLGIAALCVGAFMAFPFVFSIIFWPILQPNDFGTVTMIGALLLEIVGLGLIYLGPRLWPGLGRRLDHTRARTHQVTFPHAE